MTSNFVFRCRGCGFQTNCTCNVAPTTVAVERLASGQKSMLCPVCHAARTGAVPESVHVSVRVEVEHWRKEQQRRGSN